MTNVFVSRPTWVSPDFHDGMEAFLEFIQGHNLKHRTIGSTDFPTKCPLDDVIGLMKECKGAVILGYPQIRIETGFIKSQEVESPILLPTEWNHIEAGLAYASGLPLLVFHHIGVSRGVFDRGAISSFIYEVDFTDRGWPLKKHISGALLKWKQDVLNIDSTPEQEAPELSQEALSLLSDIDKCEKSSSKGISLMKMSGSTGSYEPYIWDNMIHGALNVNVRDLTPIMAAVSELQTMGYLQFQYAGGALEHYRRTKKPKP